MTMKLVRFILVCSICTSAVALRRFYPRLRKTVDVGEGAGDPVFLTPFLDSDNIEAGRNAAEVHGLLEDVRSYAGYFTVNKTCNSNLYFWYFPAEKDPETAPVVLWLQGGPGASSMFGLFEENGPIYVTKSGSLKRRKHYWSQVLNLIYIDNPVGTGYSFTGLPECFATDEVRVGDDLYSALIQFFRLFPHLQMNEFYLSGESYAGKYVPAAGYAIHKYNKERTQKINLKGLAIGNGLCDPENMLNYSGYLYQIGLLDEAGRDVFEKAQQNVIQDIRKGNYERAFETFDALLNGDMTPYKSEFFNRTGFSFYFNYLHEKDYSPDGSVETYIQSIETRKKIHVGNLTFNSGEDVEAHLKKDVMQSVKPWIEELLEHYRILFYNGQLDIIVAYPLTLGFLQSLEWSGAELYKTAPRKQWRVGSDLAGYSKTAKHLTEVLVRNAGHMVPTDQPLWALDLITRFALNKDF